MNQSDIHSSTLSLTEISNNLLLEWCDGLLKHQIKHLESPGLKGGILSPAFARIEGRCAESVYPLLHLAHTKGDQKYVDASILLFRWAERNVCFPDGSWVNEVSISDWRGVTVNAVIALAEALKWHGDVLDKKEKECWINRLRLSSEYVYKHFDLGFGNINYPIVSSYAMALVGQVLDEPKYIKRGNYLAEQVLPYFTKKDKLLYGEGQPYDFKSPKGCLALDLGYNVEESLPAFALYGLLTKNDAVLELLTKSLQAHLEFMLPDGAWDNSWGTRNYKWTYWGSRNSDGAQPAYALLADRDSRFYKAALLNTKLLKSCTFDGLLQSGPHNQLHGELPSIHHTFCHAKALATILDYGISEENNVTDLPIPREEEKGVVEFSDIQTHLISTGNLRATITGYDREYEVNTHASGGALSLLWHRLTGPIFCASLAEYRLIEASNMHLDFDPHTIDLTPRIELEINGAIYKSSLDHKATIEITKEDKNTLEFEVHSTLVDGIQNHPFEAPITFKLKYIFKSEEFSLIITNISSQRTDALKLFLPIISTSDEDFIITSENECVLQKSKASIQINSSEPIYIGKTRNGRIFNFVPGFEAIPLTFDINDKIEIILSIKQTNLTH